jgi:hypothetical protein
MKLDERYFESLLASEKASDGIARLMQSWGGRAIRCRDEERLGLSTPEFNVEMVVMYDGDVGNGGHAQFFLNPGGRQVREVLAALEAVGLDRIRGVLLEACSVFPGGEVPRAHDERERTMEALPAAAKERWDALDRTYYGLNRDIDGVLLAYLRAHREEVLVPERAR